MPIKSPSSPKRLTHRHSLTVGAALLLATIFSAPGKAQSSGGTVPFYCSAYSSGSRQYLVTDIFQARWNTSDDQTNAFIQTLNRQNISYDGRPICLHFDTSNLADRHRTDGMNHYRNNVGATIVSVGFWGAR